MIEPTITLDQLNTYLCQRQGLNRERCWTARSALTAPPGLYGSGPTTFLSLLARYTDLHLEGLHTALYVDRTLVRWGAMRRSVFAVPRPSLPVVYQATRHRALQALKKFLARAGVEPSAYIQTADRIEQVLAGKPMTASEIKKALGTLEAPVERAFQDVMGCMSAEGRIVRGRVRGGWKSTLYEYDLFKNWLPDVGLDALEPEEAQSKLAYLYFDTYGPATFEDFHWWSGHSRAEAEGALDSLKRQLVPVSIRNLPGEHFALNERLDQLHTASAKTSTGMSLLPVWDAYLMAYRERMRYLAKKWYDRVYDASGNSTSVILINGSVAGVWDTERDREALTVKVALFEPAGSEEWHALRLAAERLAVTVQDEGLPVRVLRCPSPPPLHGANWNQFHFPLRGCRGEPA